MGDGTFPSPVGKKSFELFTSCEPCAMCLGASLWSGVKRMVCGATKDDAQAIGFDEGKVCYIFEYVIKLFVYGCNYKSSIKRKYNILLLSDN